MPFQLNEYHRNIPKEDLIADLKRVAKENNLVSVSQKLYGKLGKYTHKVFYANFGSWNNALIEAGLEISSHRNISTEDLFANIESVWVLLGRQPTYTEMNTSISRYSTKPYECRFGSWRKALLAFVEYVNETPLSEIIAPEKTSQVKTSRNINPRLRFLVMQRDYFKCCACGASPAKDPAVLLHVDHIIPWSKGGPTTMENLQTLCSECNLGKGDLEF